ncbi:MAG: hypothetical protein RLW62_00870, partial [Gammaproteobacteria bacterium]
MLVVVPACATHAQEDFATAVTALLAGDAAQVRVAGQVLFATPFLRELYATPVALWTPDRLAALQAAI